MTDIKINRVDARPEQLQPAPGYVAPAAQTAFFAGPRSGTDVAVPAANQADPFAKRLPIRTVRTTCMQPSPSPTLDLHETGEDYLISADVAGVAKEDIAVNVTGNQITISANKRYLGGERTDMSDYHLRSYGQWSRTLNLPPDADVGKPDAKYLHGELIVKFPKRMTPSARPQQPQQQQQQQAAGPQQRG